MTARVVRAATYVRVSTADQIDNTSLDDQRKLCRAAIDIKDGWEFVREYADEGRSGTDSERPAWRQMLSDVHSGKIDAVVVAKLDRFARKAADAIRETDRLAELGAVLVVVKEQIDLSTPAGKAMRTMLAGFAEFERDTIVGRTVAGQRAKASAGGWPGGKPSFGWRLEGLKRDAHAVVDEREREVIRTAYTLFVKQRMTTGQVAERLNELGLLPRFTTGWQYQTVRQTFTNPTLWTGVMTWGSTQSISTRKGAHKTRMNRDGTPKYGASVEVDMGEPPLTRQEWLALQRAINRKAVGHSVTPAAQQMLTGRVFGECGKHYNGVTLTARNSASYRCSGRRHRANGGSEKCTCSEVRAELIDGPVWREIAALLGDPARLEAMAKKWLELPADSDLSDDGSMIAALQRQAAKIERALSRAMDDMYLADDPADHHARVERFKGELADLRERLSAMAAVKAQRQESAQRLTDLARLAERATGRLADMPPTQRRDIIELLDVRVYIDAVRNGAPETIKISGSIDPRLFEAHGGNQTSSKQHRDLFAARELDDGALGLGPRVAGLGREHAGERSAAFEGADDLVERAGERGVPEVVAQRLERTRHRYPGAHGRDDSGELVRQFT
jgi:DNA invertase Pin-like site-specific DNA recombinase